MMIESKEDLLRYLKMDQFALDEVGRKPRLFGDETWKFEIILRKHEYYNNCGKSLFHKCMKMYYKYRHHMLGIKLGLQIPINVFGGGLRINHYGLVIVNPHVKIGEWCDIHQGINIGRNIGGECPILGNNVYIGPGAKLFGNIVLGDNMMIGANAVVTKSFPDGNCRIAGVPAKIISNEPNAFIRKLESK